MEANALRALLTDLEALEGPALRAAWLAGETEVRATLRSLDGTAPATAEALSRRWVTLCGRVAAGIDTSAAGRA